MQTQKISIDGKSWFAETWITANQVKELCIFKGPYEFASYRLQLWIFFFIEC